MKEKKKKLYLGAFLMKFFIYLATVITVASLCTLLVHIITKGVPYLSKDLFALKYNSDNVSLLPALVNTIFITLLALLLAVPVGIGSAVFLTEYSKKGNRFIGLVRITAETLSGIPSICYGLFGSLFFVMQLNWGLSIASGSFTVAIMILPTVMRTTEEALMGVSDSYREGSFGLGAGRLRTVFRVVLPSAVPGILSGVILSTGRIVGETAALMFTAGTVTDYITKLSDSGRTLALHMYVLSGEGFHTNQAYATAVILLVLVILINGLARLVAGKLGKGRTN